MIGGNLPNLQFHNIHVSKEKSNCPLIPDALRIEKKINKYKKSDIVISQRFGKRVLINSKKDNKGEIRDNFLEIVDYDPIKELFLIMGPKEPRIETPLHWFILHARDEINAVVQINNINFIENLNSDLPTTEKEYPIGTLDYTKEILKNLRDSKIVIIKNQSILFVGSNLKEVEDLIFKNLRNKDEN